MTTIRKSNFFTNNAESYQHILEINWSLYDSIHEHLNQDSSVEDVVSIFLQICDVDHITAENLLEVVVDTALIPLGEPSERIECFYKKLKLRSAFTPVRVLQKK